MRNVFPSLILSAKAWFGQVSGQMRFGDSEPDVTT